MWLCTDLKGYLCTSRTQCETHAFACSSITAWLCFIHQAPTRSSTANESDGVFEKSCMVLLRSTPEKVSARCACMASSFKCGWTAACFTCYSETSTAVEFVTIACVIVLRSSLWCIVVCGSLACRENESESDNYQYIKVLERWTKHNMEVTQHNSDTDQSWAYQKYDFTNACKEILAKMQQFTHLCATMC